MPVIGDEDSARTRLPGRQTFDIRYKIRRSAVLRCMVRLCLSCMCIDNKMCAIDNAGTHERIIGKTKCPPAAGSNISEQFGNEN